MDWEKIVADWRGFVGWAAGQFAKGGHACFAREDFEQEAYEVLVKIKLKRPELPDKEFGWLFKASVMNRFRDLWRGWNRERELIATIDLSDEVVDHQDLFSEVVTRCALEHARELLQTDDRRVLQEMIQPSQETMIHAMMDEMDREAKRAVGRRVNYQGFYLLDRHIGWTLGMETGELGQSIKRIRNVLSPALSPVH